MIESAAPNEREPESWAYREHPPGPRLSPYVDCFWTSCRNRPSPPTRVLPDGCLDILFSLTPDETPSARIVGTMTRPLWVEHLGPVHTVAVRFRPGGAFPFFGALPDLTDQVVSLSELWKDDARLIDALHHCPGAEARVRLLERELARRLDGLHTLDPMIACAVTFLRTKSSTLSIQELSDNLGVSRQHLTRKFKERVGLSPKAFSCLMRVRGVLDACECVDLPNWTSLALEHGFFDQAHLTAEFRRWIGQTPGQFRAR